ncbi:hypothetical protein LJC56_10480, partial [Christensenellaceae bacterium OttesenSCG-928-K19]|nr:hypothetical protein [Christensenellaceae bacterium OttesenSCG-928-K19]
EFMIGKKLLVVILCILLAATVFAGCSPADATAGIDEVVVTEENASLGDAEESGNWIEFILFNETDTAFTDIRISDANVEDPGYNHIESITTLGSYESCTIGVEEYASYNVFVNCDDGSVLSYYGVDFGEAREARATTSMLTVYYHGGVSSDFPAEMEGGRGESTDAIDDVDTSKHMSAELAVEIYALMQSCNYEIYWSAFAEDWAAYSDEERDQAAADILNFARAVNVDIQQDAAGFREELDQADISSYCLWSVGCDMLNVPDQDFYTDVYLYQQAIDMGLITPAPDAVLETADSLLAVGGGYSPLLCLGRNHELHSITMEWATKEDFFAFSSYISPMDDVDQSFYCSGENGVIQELTLGDLDLLPLLAEIGATDASGTIVHDPIHFYAVNMFNAPQVFILSKDESGTVHINVLLYDQASGEYAWDGQTYLTNELCCFSNENVFYYMDESGILQPL